jgi:hypothetical protein
MKFDQSLYNVEIPLIAPSLPAQILIDMVKGKCALCPMGGAGDALGGYKVRLRDLY